MVGFNVMRRYEMEMNMTRTVEADVLRLREIRDNLTLTISNLEISVEELKEELVHMAQSHKEVRAADCEKKYRVFGVSPPLTFPTAGYREAEAPGLW